MTSPDMDDEAMKMARRIADELIPDPENESVVYKSFHRTAERAALAAIIETRDRDAALADRRVSQIKALYSDDIGMSDARVACQLEAEQFAAAIRSGQQFRKDV